MALDICNYTPITNCLLQSSNDRFSFLFTQVCNLINSSDSNYVLPIATDTVLGGIIVGDGLSMDPDTGVLSVIPDFIPSLRFGIEDNLSDQDRQFDLGGFTFELFSDTGDITQYGSIFLDNESVSATASNGVTVGGFDAQVNGARIFSNEGDIIKQISTTESAIEVLQTDGIDTYIQTFPLSTGFVVTSVNNVLADQFGNVDISSVTASTFEQVTTAGNTSTNAISVGEAITPTSMLDIYNSTIASIASTTSGISLINNSPATSLSTEKSSPAIYFKGSSWDLFGTSVDTNFKIYNKSTAFGTGLLAGTQKSSLKFSSTDTGVERVPLTLNSNGDVIMGNGVTFLYGDSRMTAPTTMRYNSVSRQLKQEFFNSVGPLLANGTHMWIYNDAGTSGAGANTLKVWGDANLNLMTCFTDGNTTFGSILEAHDPFAVIQMDSKGRGLKLPRLTTLQRDNMGIGIVSVDPGLGGSGYLIPPSVNVPAPTGGGLKARVTAVLGSGVTAGQVISYTVDFRGTNYPSAPTLTLDNTGTGGVGNPDGSGATIGTVTVNTIAPTQALVIYNTEADSGNGGIQFLNGAGVWKTLATL